MNECPARFGVDFNRAIKLPKSAPPFVNAASNTAGRNANILCDRRSRMLAPVQFCDVNWRRSTSASAVALPGPTAGATEQRKIPARSEPQGY